MKEVPFCDRFDFNFLFNPLYAVAGNFLLSQDGIKYDIFVLDLIRTICLFRRIDSFNECGFSEKKSQGGYVI